MTSAGPENGGPENVGLENGGPDTTDMTDKCRLDNGMAIRAGNGSLELTHDPLTHLICDP